jgi:hypothetical protein
MVCAKGRPALLSGVPASARGWLRHLPPRRLWPITRTRGGDLVAFSDIDVYSLVDADSEEARTFTTYLGYWECLAEHVQERYGDDYAPELLSELRRQRGFRKLAGQGKPAHPDAVRALLLNGWTSELRLNLIELADTKRLTLANHGAPIDAYYATSRHATAWLCVRDGSAPTNHRGLLNAISAQVTGSRLYPAPWRLHCSSLYPQPAYEGFPGVPRACSNLAVKANRYDRAAMLLRTTRERGVKKKVEEEKQKRKLDRAPAGEKQRQDRQLAATTVFDFAWRMRARSNYGDPAMFYVGSLHHARARTYGAAVRTWTSATMFLFEALIAQRARGILEEAAVHFLSRDRSDLAEALIIPRLRGLGLLTRPPSVSDRHTDDFAHF